MEFIYAAVNNTETVPIKGKISKWRHLETTVTQLILIGLVLFLIMQNGNLRKEISNKLSHQVFEDLFSQKIVQVSKEIQEVKILLLDTRRKNSLQNEQLQKILKVLIKQIGLPLPVTTEEIEKQSFSLDKYQVLQEEENSRTFKNVQKGFSIRRVLDEEDCQQDSQEQTSFDNGNEEEDDEEENEESSNETEFGNYREYLEEDIQSEKETGKQQDNFEDNSSEEKSTSNVKRIDDEQEEQDIEDSEVEDDQSMQTYFSLFKSSLIIGCHILLISLVFVCIFILRAMIKNPKYRSKSGQKLQNLLKVGSRKKDSQHSHSMPQKKIISL